MSLPEKPLTRRELYLAKAAGQDVTLPETDLTREEMYLREIANGGGGGDVTKEYVDNAIANAVADIDDDISALSDTVADKVDKVNGKGLSTNDYTDADKALVQDSPITVTATTSPISTANGKPRKLTIFGKSEVVDGVIKSTGEGWSTVRLADLTWIYASGHFVTNSLNNVLRMPASLDDTALVLCDRYEAKSYNASTPDDKYIIEPVGITNYYIWIKDDDYTTLIDFTTSLGDAELVYELADPTQGNTIAVKTDNGTGVDGTMAVFETGTPLYGVSDTVRDVMVWDGSAGEVTKKCNKVRLADLTWAYSTLYDYPYFVALLPTPSQDLHTSIISSNYIEKLSLSDMIATNQSYCIVNNSIRIRDDDYTTVSDFVASLGDAELVYELATPTATPLTTAENENLAGLKTYAPSTTVTINDNPDYSIEAYANTANGQAISDMQPTRSPLLTLSASGWSNNAQTVTYEHDTSKRNTIDVEPANIKAWTAAGILATAETASTITFECDTVPTADLSFRVTSMEVR